MLPILLDYGLRPNRTDYLVRKLKLIAIGVVVVCTAFGVRFMSKAIAHELSLGREEKRLLTANAPSSMFPSLAVRFTAEGKVLLPDGRAARLAEIDLTDEDDQKRLPKDFADLIRSIEAQKIGYTINGFDSNAVPVVHLWALSPNEYGAFCGMTGPETRRTFRWLLWRNISATLRDQKEMVWNEKQAEWMPEHTKVNY